MESFTNIRPSFSSPHAPHSLRTVPNFTNFTVTNISPSGLVSLLWSLATPGLRPLIQLSIQWVAESDVQTVYNLTDPRAYPVVNLVTVEYNQSQPLERGSAITHTIQVEGLEQGETYFVGVTGSNVLDSKTTLFQFTAGTLTTAYLSSELTKYYVRLFLSICVCTCPYSGKRNGHRFKRQLFFYCVELPLRVSGLSISYTSSCNHMYMCTDTCTWTLYVILTPYQEVCMRTQQL